MATFSYARLFIASLALGLVMAGNAAAQTQSPPKPAEATSAAKTLKTSIIWQDEFEGPSGGAPDPHKWSYDLGAGGWGNNELEEYTNSRENSALNGQGQLVITVRRDAAGHYTSARLKTEAKFDFTFGRAEARIKIPKGQGIWPASWMLGSHIEQVGWPASGEIDIMENIGKEPRINHGSVHGPGYSGGQDITGEIELRGTQILADDYHVYALDWSPDAWSSHLMEKSMRQRRPLLCHRMANGFSTSRCSCSLTSRWGKLARQSRCEHGVSAADACRLRSSVQSQC